MQQAIPFRTWALAPISSTDNKPETPFDARKLAAENTVIVFCRRGCCMGHVIKRLLVALGVNPAAHEVEEADESDLMRQLHSSQMLDLNQKSGTLQLQQLETTTLPLVFVGGSFLGGLDKVMAMHITGELVPVLKRAGALWL